ncbi:restriction endonuclease subunit S [Candidatus Poribacteria bacterium]|nr:restriction endonuclease subunit S [Candidatus Poribacteria bacterium]
MTTGLPRGWSVAKLGECCATVEKVDPRKYPDTSFDYIDIGGIEPGSGRIEVTKRLRGRDAPSRARQLVRAGDVILSTVRTYQRKTAIVPESLDGAIASTGFCVLRPHRGVDSRFVLHQLLDNRFVERLSEKQSGTSYPAVRDRDVRAMGIRLAPEVEQRRIVAAIEEHYSRLDAAERALVAADHRLHALYRSVAVDAFDRPDWDWTTLGEIAEAASR